MQSLYRMTDIIFEVEGQINPSERLQNSSKQIVSSEIRKLAIILLFPLLRKYNMPIKLV